MKKRISALCIAIAMMICMIPTGAFALDQYQLVTFTKTELDSDTAEITMTITVPDLGIDTYSAFEFTALFNKDVIQVKSISTEMIAWDDDGTPSQMNATNKSTKTTANSTGKISIAYAEPYSSMQMSGKKIATIVFERIDGAAGDAGFEYQTIKLQKGSDVMVLTSSNVEDIPIVSVYAQIAQNIPVTGLTTPTAGADVDRTVTTSAVGVSEASIVWKKGDTVFSGTKFEYGTVYTAVITVKAADYYKFESNTQFSVDGSNDGWTVAQSGDDYTLTKTFEKTADAQLLSISVTSSGAVATYDQLHDGVALDKSLIKVTGHYEGGSDIVETEYDIVYQHPEYGKLQKGDLSVTIKKGEKTAEYTLPQAVAGKAVTTSDFSFPNGKVTEYTGSDLSSGLSPKSDTISSAAITVKFKTGEPAVETTVISAGAYGVYVTVSDADLHYASASEFKLDTVIVTKQSIDASAATWSSEDHFVYDGITHAVSISGIDMDKVNVAYTSNSGVDAHDYVAKAVVTPKDTDNYVVTGQPQDKQWSIAKKTVNITSADAEKEYDSTPLTCHIATPSGFVEGQGVTFTFTGSQTAIGESSNTYTYTANANTNLSNYTIINNYGRLSVTKSWNLNTSLTMQGWTYGDDQFIPVLTCRFESEGAVISYRESGAAVDTAKAYGTVTGGSVVLDPSLQRIGAGDYILSVESPSGENFISRTSEAAFTVAKKEISVSTPAVSKTYGDADPAFVINVEGLVGEDTLSGSLAREEGKDVGTYAITQGSVTNENNPNYNITFTGANLTINKKDLTFSITSDAAITYGDPEPTAYDYTAPELVAGDTLTPAFSRAPGESTASTAGAVVITATFTGIDVQNYNISVVNGKLTINPRPVTVTGIKTVDLKAGASSVTADFDNVQIGNIVSADAGDHNTLWVDVDGAITFISGSLDTPGIAKVNIPYKLTGTKADSYSLAVTSAAVDLYVRAVDIADKKAPVFDKSEAEGESTLIDLITNAADFKNTDTGIHQAMAIVAATDTTLVSYETTSAAVEILSAAGFTNPVYAIQIQPYFIVRLVSVTGTNGAIDTFTMDIQPVYDVIAVETSDVPTEVAITTGHALSVSEPVEIEMPFFSACGFGGDTPVWIMHKHGSNTYYYCAGEPQPGAVTVKFTNPYGFSEFTVMKDPGVVAYIIRNGEEVYYTNFDDLAADVKAEETIVLATDPAVSDSMQFGKAITFYIDKNGKDTNLAKLVKGKTNYTVTYTETPAGSGIYKVVVKYQAPYVPSSEPVFVNPFEDVNDTQYFYEPVMWLYKNNITKGKTDTLFMPYENCSRAQFVTFLWRQAGSPEPSADAPVFDDIDTSLYFAKAVAWAGENKITLGIGNNLFDPYSPVNRGQAVAFLYRMKKSPAVTIANPFTDVAEGAYNYNAILWAYENKITDGMTLSTFAPFEDCTRGQMAKFLYVFFDGKDAE